jgi:hypothetical protein
MERKVLLDKGSIKHIEPLGTGLTLILNCLVAFSDDITSKPYELWGEIRHSGQTVYEFKRMTCRSTWSEYAMHNISIGKMELEIGFTRGQKDRRYLYIKFNSRKLK